MVSFSLLGINRIVRIPAKIEIQPPQDLTFSLFFTSIGMDSGTTLLMKEKVLFFGLWITQRILL